MSSKNLTLRQVSDRATLARKLDRVRASAFEDQTDLIRNLIWLYMILWLIEGGVRRWFLPGLATPLLLIRDPVVVVIYFLASAKGLFPINNFIISGAALALLTFVNALAIGHGNPLVALYGMRCDFLHVPLIFIIARVLRLKNLIAMSKVALWLSIPYTLLLIAQFYAPQDAWVNRGVGGSLDGAGFSGALDRFRPPGTFSFITGPAALYPLLTACWFVLVLARKLPTVLMIASGVAIIVAIPISVSRLLFLSVVLVAVPGIAGLFAGGRFSGKVIFQVGIAAIILPILVFTVPAFKDGMEAFSARWESATTDNGGIKGALVDRVLDDLFGSLSNVGFSGFGTGFSTNVGQKLLTQETGFGASEAEWGRLLYDNGVILGISLVVYRTALAGSILLASIRAWQRRSPQSLVFTSAAFMLVLDGQWGQASIMGAAVIAGGLALAAASDFESEKIGKRRKPLRNPNQPEDTARVNEAV